jgi:hypothetical protein
MDSIRLFVRLLGFVTIFLVYPLTVFSKGNSWLGAFHKTYCFTVNTFTDRIESWKGILSEFKGKSGVRYLEIGAFEGMSALWVLENILTDPTAELMIIDTFDGPYYQRFLHNVALSGQASKFHILVGPSTEKIKEVPLGSVDFAYVDGSADGRVMLADLENVWERVKVGGLIICNRYRLTPHLRRVFGLGPRDPGPHEAIDAFLRSYGPYLKVVTFQPNYVVVRKVG